MVEFHRPVMVCEVLNFFQPLRGRIFLDATVGSGGHSAAIIHELKPTRLIGLDQDPEAVKFARERLKNLRAEIFCENFSNLSSVLSSLGIEKVSGIIFDLGVSLHQLNTPERGFSYTLAGPLDMRMSPRSQPKALDVIKHAPEEQLVKIFSDYGEEHYSKRIARAISRCRKKISNTLDLAEVIKRAVPRPKRIKSLARVFQALRICVNRELEQLEKGLKEGVGALSPQGRIVVLAYHSLEDRIVKSTFKDYEKQKSLRILTKKPLRPSLAEVYSNPHARSARLRAAERIA